MNQAHLCMSCPPAYLACSCAIPFCIHQYLSTLNKNGDIKNEVEKLFFRSTENKRSIHRNLYQWLLWVCPRVCFDVVFNCIVGHYRPFNSSVAILTLTSPIDILNVPNRSALVLLTKAESSFVSLVVCKQWCFLLTFASSHRSVGKNSSPKTLPQCSSTQPRPSLLRNQSQNGQSLSLINRLRVRSHLVPGHWFPSTILAGP